MDFAFSLTVLKVEGRNHRSGKLKNPSEPFQSLFGFQNEISNTYFLFFNLSFSGAETVFISEVGIKSVSIYYKCGVHLFLHKQYLCYSMNYLFFQPKVQILLRRKYCCDANIVAINCVHLKKVQFDQ